MDRPGIRIAAPARSAYELYLSRSLQHAELVRFEGADTTFQHLCGRQAGCARRAPATPGDGPDHLLGSRILDGNFTAVQQAAGTPKGRPAGAAYLRAFIEDIKVTGLVARTIAKHNVRGLTVAPPA